MTLCLLLLFSMLVTLSAGALYYVSRTASEAYLYQQGLSLRCMRQRAERMWRSGG